MLFAAVVDVGLRVCRFFLIERISIDRKADAKTCLMLFFVMFFNSCISYLITTQVGRNAIKFKIHLSQMVFQKFATFPLSANLSQKFNLINLITTDAVKIEEFSRYFLWLFFGPLEMAIWLGIIVFRYSLFYIFLLSLCLLDYAAKYFILNSPLKKQRPKFNKTKDEFLEFIANCFKSIFIIKCHGWESVFIDKIMILRRHYLSILKSILSFKSMIAFISAVYNQQSIVFIVTMMIVVYKDIDFKIFYSILFLTVSISNCMNTRLTRSLNALVDVIDPIRRINKFMLYDSSQKYQPHEESSEEEIRIAEIPLSSSVALIGQSGTGKTRTLRQIIRNAVAENQLVSYSDELLWIIDSSFVENITMGAALEEQRLDEVIRICRLDRDIASFPQGLEHPVGADGMFISGGQRSRLVLARVLYKQNVDLYVFDKFLQCIDFDLAIEIAPDVLKYVSGKRVVISCNNSKILNLCKYFYEIATHKITPNLAYQSYSPVIKTLSCEYAQDTESISMKLCEDSVSPLALSKASCVRSKKQKMKSPRFLHPIEITITVIVLAFVLIYPEILKLRQIYYFNLWNSGMNQTEIFLIYFRCFLFSFTLYFLRILIITVLFYVVTNRMFSKLLIHIFHTVDYVGFLKKMDGSMINRIANDQLYLDENIANVFSESLHCIATNFSQVVFISRLSNTEIRNIGAVYACTMLFTFVILRIFYVKKSKILKSDEARQKSAMLSTCNMTVVGSFVIKSGKMSYFITSKFKLQSNRCGAASIRFLNYSRKIAFFLDACTSVINSIVLYYCCCTTSVEIINFIKITLSSSEILQWAINCSQEWEESRNMYIRMSEFMSISPVPKPKKLPKERNSVPNDAEIDFDDSVSCSVSYRNFSVKYSHESDLILQDVNFTVDAGKRAAIIGRTGCGKSTLVNGLFALLPNQFCTGNILLNEIDIKTISKSLLHQILSIVPQSPIIFCASFRFNVDPTESLTDEAIWNVCNICQLDKLLVFAGKNLDFVIDGSFISQMPSSDKHRISIARVLLRARTKVVVMDETFEMFDDESKSLVHNQFFGSLPGVTVLAITHDKELISTAYFDYCLQIKNHQAFLKVLKP